MLQENSATILLGVYANTCVCDDSTRRWIHTELLSNEFDDSGEGCVLRYG